MTDRVRRQTKWIVDELLREAPENAVISVICRKNTVRVFLNGEEVAALSEDTACFGSVLSREQVERLYDIHRCCPKQRGGLKMNDEVKKQAERLAAELLRRAPEGTVVLMTVGKNSVKVYLVDRETAVLSEYVGRCSECCKAAARRER